MRIQGGSDVPLVCYFYSMKDYVNGKVLNTDSAVLVKYVMDEEDLGDGYKRYTVRRLMRRPRGTRISSVCVNS